jgi:hypothetical protein
MWATNGETSRRDRDHGGPVSDLIQVSDLTDVRNRAAEKCQQTECVPMSPILIFIMWVSLTGVVVSTMLNYRESSPDTPARRRLGA